MVSTKVRPLQTSKLTMRQPKIRERIRSIAFQLLQSNQQGLRYSELHRQIRSSDPGLNLNTINTSIWNLDAVVPDLVYKPSKGVFRLKEFEEPIIEEPPAEITAGQQSRIKEAIFYPLFASWLKNELEEVSHAISLGGNVFRDRWGTPDVLGKLESRRSDVIKGPTLIVSAEVKIDVAGLLIGFGQACAFKLFSHKSYLVIPSHAPSEEVARVDSLCQMFGIGLVTFNSKNPISPDFQLLARAIKHEPDLFYTNRYLATVEKELFS